MASGNQRCRPTVAGIRAIKGQGCGRVGEPAFSCRPSFWPCCWSREGPSAPGSWPVSPPRTIFGGHASASSSKVYDRNGRLLFEMPPPDTGRALARSPGRDAPGAPAGGHRHRGRQLLPEPRRGAWAIVRAVWINLRGGEVLSGGSTITQQLARNLLLGAEERAERTLTPQAARVDPGLAPGAALLQGRDPGAVPQRDLLWQPGLRRRGGRPDLLRQARPRPGPGRVRLAGRPAPGAGRLQPAGEPQGGPGAPARRAGPDGQAAATSTSRAGPARPRQEKLYFASAAFPIRAPHFVMYVRGQLEQELGLEAAQAGRPARLHHARPGPERGRPRHRALPAGAPGRVQRPAPTARPAAQRPQRRPGGPRPADRRDPGHARQPRLLSTRIDGAVNGTTAAAPARLVHQAGHLRRCLRDRPSSPPATMLLDVRTSFVTREGGLLRAAQLRPAASTARCGCARRWPPPTT